MIDRTTKVLLAAIAVGLFFNAAVPLIQPTDVMAEEAQRGPRGRGNVQGNVQSLGQQRAQEDLEATQRALENPQATTDTDRWLRKIFNELIDIQGTPVANLSLIKNDLNAIRNNTR